MMPREVDWGSIRLEISLNRLWVRLLGSPVSGALFYGAIGVVIWCIFCIPCLVMKAKIDPSLYWIFGAMALAMVVIGAFAGKKAQETGFIVSLDPSPSLSLMQGGEAIVLPAEELLRFVTRKRDYTVVDNRATYYSLVAETRRGEFVILHELACTKKSADTFGRLLTALLLEKVRFDVAVNQLLEERSRDYARATVMGLVLVVALILTVIFVIRYI